MKWVFILLFSFLFTVKMAVAQPPELFTKNWKVEKITTVYKSNTVTLFHKDSTTSLVNLSNLNYRFFSNGTYTTLSDTLSGQATWALNPTSDSIKLDTTSYKLIELSALHFTTRGYTLQLADSLGAMDTAYTYVVLYPSAPLPVNLTYFSGRYTGKEIQLNWSTAQEQQSKEFQVQYSTNGTGFETIGSVAAKGNSNTPVSYQFTTGRYQSGKNFYRLKQVDIDGRTALSPVAVINIDGLDQSTISLSPNPTSGKLHLYIRQAGAGKLQLRLVTLAGQQVWATPVASVATNSTLSLPTLPKGVYVATVTDSKGKQLLYTKLVIQ